MICRAPTPMKSDRKTDWRPLLSFLAVLGLAAGSPVGSPAAPVNDHLNFQRLLPRDGLPAAVVYCGMEDSRGFLWFGTADGVARYDGHHFRVFRPDPADPESLANGAVLGIQEDAQGNLWMATEGGLDLWHRDTERFSHFRHNPTDATSLSDDTTQSILLDRDGTLWVGTTRGGLNHFDPRSGKFERFESNSKSGRSGGVTDPWIRCLFRDRLGILWIGTGNGGLNRLDPATRQISAFVHDPADPHSLSHNRVSAIAEDRDGNLWVGTDGGLCRLDPARRTLERIPLEPPSPDELPNQTVTALIVDDDGSIWFGTDGGGFCRYDPASRRFAWHRHSKYATNTLAADAVRTVFQDRSGDFWVGHFPAGISHVDRLAAAFQVFTSISGEANTLSDDNVLSFLEDPSGDLWVGTDNGGLNHWSAATGRWRSYGHSPRDPGSLSGKAATDILRDHSGRLWVGTWDGGLNRFEPQTGSFRHYLPQPGQNHSLSDVHIWQMAEDHAHQLWIATIGGGVERYVPGTDDFVHYRHDPANPRSLNDDIASALLVTRDGTLWVGTPKGLARWNPATQDWDRFLCQSGHPGTLSNYWIFDLLEDRAGMIWTTTEGGGLHRLDPRTGQCTHFRTADGLASDVLRGLLEDTDGALWIGSNQGLMRFDPRTRHVRIFDESNGLPGRQLNPHARLRLASGDLLFGTTRGFIRFDPRALPIDSRPPPVVFTGFEVFNETMAPAVPGSPLSQSITETRRLEIPARLSLISFQFAALSFRAPERAQYRFKLEGFDDDWRKPGAEHRATFTNLDPGHYRLRVQAANSDGVWNEAGATLDLIVVPPWWRTRWFMAAASLLLLGGAVAVGWAISAQRERETRHRHELATERERAQEREQAAEALRILNQDLERRVADRTAQLVSAVKELEAFSYSVSHDLRTPLRSIDGFSRVLLEDNANQLDADGKDSLHRIRAASQRMGHLIDDLLNLAQVSRGEMRRGPVDLSALARTVAEELQQAMPERRLEFVIAPDLVATGDPRLLQVVLENLLGNACKFSSRQPVARIEFGRTMHDGAPTYYVRDNGAGFDMSCAQKLFGSFQRLHTTAEFPGTGIGLATVQRIIHRHGGRVGAGSELGHGATFYFTLPEQPVEQRT